MSSRNKYPDIPYSTQFIVVEGVGRWRNVYGIVWRQSKHVYCYQRMDYPIPYTTSVALRSLPYRVSEALRPSRFVVPNQPPLKGKVTTVNSALFKCRRYTVDEYRYRNKSRAGQLRLEPLDGGMR